MRSKWNSLIPAILVLIFCTGIIRGGEVKGGFEGSNVVDIEEVSANNFTCKLATPFMPPLDAAWYAGGSHYLNWFMLKIENAAGEPVTVTITNASWGGNEFWGDYKDPVYTEAADPNTLSAETTWQRVTNHSWTNPNYTFTLTPSADLAWVALCYPALPSHTANWVAQCGTDPAVSVETVCTTEGGYPVHVLFIANGSSVGKNGILVYGQEHGNEQTGGWTCQGLAEFLISGESTAETLLDNCVFIIIPDIGPDATAAGSCMDPVTGRVSHHFNPAGYDRFMAGCSIPIPPAQEAIWNRIVSFIDSGGKIDLAINIHQGGMDNLYGMYEGYGTGSPEPLAQNYDSFILAYMPSNNSPWVPNEQQGYSYGGWQEMAPGGWCSLRLFGRCWEEWGTIPIGYEISVGSRTSPSNFLTDVSGVKYFGEAMARSVYDYYGGFTRTVTVASPNGGETLASGSSVSILWSSTGTPGNVRIDFSADNGRSWSELSGSTANDGSESVTLPSVNSSACLIRVAETDSCGVADISNSVFTVGTPPAGTITVTSPNGGETWDTNWRENVTWSSTGSISNVSIELSPDNGSTWKRIGWAVANTGSYLVNVPNTPSSTCLVRVVGMENSSVSDVSDAVFTIQTRPAPPEITVTSPGNGDLWVPGGTETVSWTGDASVINVGISLSTDGGVTWSVLVSSTPNDGTQTVSVPSVESSECIIFVYDAAAEAYFGGADRDPQNRSDGLFAIGTVPPLSAAPEGTPDSGTAPLTVEFSANASGGKEPYTFFWDFGDGSGTSAEENPEYTYSLSDTYTVVLTVTDADMSSVEESFDITVVNLPPTASISASLNVTVGEDPGFDGSGSSDTDGTINVYEWDFDYDGVTFDVQATDAAPAWSYGSTGIYTAALRVTDDDSATDIETGTITVYDAADTDGDGLPDTWEETYFPDTSTYDENDDPDNDGLNNLQEYIAGTSPDDNDSDDDGIPDGTDPDPLTVAAGGDGTKPSSGCMAGRGDSEFNILLGSLTLLLMGVHYIRKENVKR